MQANTSLPPYYGGSGQYRPTSDCITTTHEHAKICIPPGPAHHVLPTQVLALHAPKQPFAPTWGNNRTVKCLTVDEWFGMQLTHDDYVLDFNEVEVKCSGCSEGVVTSVG